MRPAPASRPADGEVVSRALGLAVLGASALAVALTIGRTRSSTTAAPPRPIAALRGAAALLGLSVFADSAMEHWRGGFRNPGMFAPVGISALLMGANLGAIRGRGRKARAADGIHGAAVALGAAGVGFHAWNILRRPGAFSWQNLFYAAPVGAPVALALAGMLGLGADHTRVTPAGRLTLADLPVGRALAALVAAGLAGTTAEVGLLHFRGNFQNRYM
nr:hypothetical protein [Caulobacteraceae bacterium]